MAERAALITGGSGGIGLAVARRLGELGYGLTISGRRPEKLEATASQLSEEGFEVDSKPADVTDEQQIVDLVDHHKQRWGRIDALVNNAGIGIGQTIDEISTKRFDMQVAINLRAPVVATRESVELLRQAGDEHGKALILNMASIAGKGGQPWLSIYSATKSALISFSQSTQRELQGSGVQVTAFAPGFVDTDMSDFVREHVGQDNMIRPTDIADAVGFILGTSPNCLVPEIVFSRAGADEGNGTP